MWYLLLLLITTGLSAETIRVGHFPNVTHAQGVIGHGLTRAGQGWFEKYLGPDVQIEWYVYNAGPSAMEAVFTQALDLTYVGPGPTINAYVKSKGKELAILSGACSKGAALVVQDTIKTAADLKGKKLGTPGLGNTQDIAARAWLKSQGFHTTLTGGDVLVVPTDNPEQLLLFKSKNLDAVWTIEPWVSILLMNGGGKVFFEERVLWPETNGNYVTTHLISSTRFLRDRPELAEKFVRAHVELTDWINSHPNEAKLLFSAEMKKETFHNLPKAILDQAWNHLEFTHDPIKESLFRDANQAYQIGFLKTLPDLAQIYQLNFLNAILRKKGLKEIP